MQPGTVLASHNGPFSGKLHPSDFLGETISDTNSIMIKNLIKNNAASRSTKNQT
jgi:hypothetical protein